MKILPNGVAVIEGDSHHGTWCATEGLVHDLFTANIIRKVIRDYNVKVCVDAGANIGTLTRVMTDAGCWVHAFECNPAAVECLRYNCPTATVYECGLSDMARKAQFVPIENAGASYINDAGSESGFYDRDTPKIQLQRLDNFAITPGLIKYDVEGFEVKAIQGGMEMIKRSRPVILCEFNKGALERAGNTDSELLALLQSLGYIPEIIQPDCTWGDPQFDVLCYP